jgi:putative transposase
MRNNPREAKMLFPIDSTVVSLTSKLFWAQKHHQVKLLNGVNVSQGYVGLGKGMTLNILTTLPV